MGKANFWYSTVDNKWHITGKAGSLTAELSTRLKIGNQPGEATAYIIDGYGYSLGRDYSATAMNRIYVLEINADTGGVDVTGDTNIGAIKGRVVAGTTQTNCGISGIIGTLDVGNGIDLISNHNGLCGVLDFYGDTTIGGSVSHTAALTGVVWNEGTTTLNSAGGCVAGLDLVQNSGSPTLTAGINPAIFIRGGTSSKWQYGIYMATGHVSNGILFSCVNNGIDVTSTTLNATAGRVGKFYGAIAAANLGDGYGAFEVDVTLTGTSAGHTAALSSWLNLPSGTVTAGNFLCAQSNGIYEASGVTMGAGDLIFGMRASAILGDTTGWGALAPFSLNTGNQSITAIFQIASGPAIGLVNGSPSTSTVSTGTIPIVCNAGGGSVRYVHVYDSTS